MPKYQIPKPIIYCKLQRRVRRSVLFHPVSSLPEKPSFEEIPREKKFLQHITKMTFPPVTCCQSQIVCSGCKNLLIYPAGATSICCALCHAVSPVPTSGLATARLVCTGCYTLLIYSRGATSVRCSCCHTVNSASKANHTAHINCGNCRATLMFQFGAHSVKCTLCSFVTSVGTWKA